MVADTRERSDTLKPDTNWTQGEKRERETRGVERTLAVVGPGGPVKGSNIISKAPMPTHRSGPGAET